MQPLAESSLNAASFSYNGLIMWNLKDKPAMLVKVESRDEFLCEVTTWSTLFCKVTITKAKLTVYNQFFSLSLSLLIFISQKWC